jgi:hypothetical protein
MGAEIIRVGTMRKKDTAGDSLPVIRRWATA